jgi:GMP synthase-like glutamine amidotransferase
MPSRLHIAMFNADVPVPNVFPVWSTYGNMFHDLLVAAASRIAPDVEIHSTDYNIQQLEYPESLTGIDVILITGSASSTYDEKTWIRRLSQLILHIYTRHPHIKMFGSCFGHQLICQTLLQEYGVRVEKDPNGWELGVRESKLNEEFRHSLRDRARPLLMSGSKEPPENLRMQFIHADHVLIPSPGALPASWMIIGSTLHCSVQGVYEPGRVLTLQGHFEFNRFVSTEIIKLFGATWKPDVLKETLESIDMDDDAEVAAEMVLQFMLENEELAGCGTHSVISGLRIPPHIE